MDCKRAIVVPVVMLREIKLDDLAAKKHSGIIGFVSDRQAEPYIEQTKPIQMKEISLREAPIIQESIGSFCPGIVTSVEQVRREPRQRLGILPIHYFQGF